MNFDRNGVLVTTSRPKPVLRKAYRTITVDSRDRDPTKYVKVNGGALSSDPGDYVVYFPRPFQKVTRIRLMNAAMLGVTPSDTYIMMQLEGLNRMDETASGADRSGYVDSTFAKILNDRPVVATGAAYTYSTITGITNRTFTTPTLSIGSASAATVTAVAGTSVTYGGFTLPTNLGFTDSLKGSFITLTGFANAFNNGTFQVTGNTTTTVTVTGNAGATTVGASGTITTAATFNLGLTVTSVSSTIVTFTSTQTILGGTVVTIYGFTGAAAAYNGTWAITNPTPSLTFTIPTPAGVVSGASAPTVNSTGFVANVGGNASITAATANSALTNITFTASNTYSVGQNVNVSGYTGLFAPLNGNYVVLSASSAAFTVASTAPIPGGTFQTTGTTQPTCLISASGNGSALTYTFNGAHNINIGQTITVSLPNQSGGIFMTGVVTSVPSSSTLTMASTYNATAFVPPAILVTVNNLQYSYVTTITTSFVTGQYLVISGFTDTPGGVQLAKANTAAQILQSSLSTGTSGTFETTNIIYSTAGLPSTLTAAGTSGTAIISQAIYYNDMSYAPNITYYNPPIGTLDRLHITLRRHLPLSSVTTTNPVNAPITFGPAENTFTFEIEYIDNVFEDVSSFETRLDNADYTPKFQV